MGILDNLNRRIKKFDLIDEKLAQSAAFFIALFIAKVWPPILNLNIWLIVLGAVLCGINRLYVLRQEKEIDLRF